ncbi:MAG TPA: ECF-type sigma factor [Longimicrobiales bacterium]|nr:ECF-type sigma factor [Longimicrobiales bacterium]
MSSAIHVTQLLQAARQGQPHAVEEIWSLVYEELRSLARRQLRYENPDAMLQATALVHEAFLKLAGAAATAENRNHFVSIAARAMRQVLVDEARRRQALKRGGPQVNTTLCEGTDALAVSSEELLVLDAALQKLEPRQREIVELRFFGGLSEVEVAETLGVSDRTVRREWVKARAWLYRELYPAT